MCTDIDIAICADIAFEDSTPLGIVSLRENY